MMREIFLTFFYSGKSPYAPGTVGSLAAIPFGVAILYFLSPSTLFLAAILLSVIAIREINRFENEGGEHDSSKIVIDEVAGMWIALSLSGGTLLQIVLSFLFFRLLDIKKPSYIGRIDREVNGGLGVMGDDLLAGLFAGLLSALCFNIITKLFG